MLSDAERFRFIGEGFACTSPSTMTGTQSEPTRRSAMRLSRDPVDSIKAQQVQPSLQ
ncbi:MAG: hypothetical protein NVSMB53_03870 [Gemmatimonadaceae bacterium]